MGFYCDVTMRVFHQYITKYIIMFYKMYLEKSKPKPLSQQTPSRIKVPQNQGKRMDAIDTGSDTIDTSSDTIDTGSTQ